MHKFSMDFDVNNKVSQNFMTIFNTFGVPNTIVEIGVFEGATTVWLCSLLSSYNKNLKIYAIDPHNGSKDLPDIDFSVIQSNFLHNINVEFAEHIIYKNQPSTIGLTELINEKIKAELIYIDGDHTASQVLVDLVLSWMILPKNGIILCDDVNNWKYRDKNNTFQLQNSPKIAVDYFIHCNFENIAMINLPHIGQVAFKKLCD